MSDNQQPLAPGEPPIDPQTEPSIDPPIDPPHEPIAPIDLDELNPTPKKVRRLTEFPILIIGTVFLVLLAAVALLGTRRKQPIEIPNPAEQPAQTSNAELLRRRAERLQASQRPRTSAGIYSPRRLPPRTVPKQKARTAAARPVPVLVSAFHTSPRSAPSEAEASTPDADLLPAFPSLIGDASAVGDVGAAGTAGDTPDLADRDAPDNNAERFLASAEATEAATLAAIRTPAASAFQLAASSRIPAILQTEINSDLPGRVRAVVRRNVYDSITGTHLLVPRGATLYGQYNHRVVWGERRVLLLWQRIIFPDGSSLDLEGMPGVDGLGASGLNDLVNNHFVRLYANALLLSAVTAGYQISQDASRDSDLLSRNASASEIASAAVAQELTKTSNLVLRRNANIKPTLRIRPGFLFAVEVTRDLAFSEPYSAMAAIGP